MLLNLLPHSAVLVDKDFSCLDNENSQKQRLVTIIEDSNDAVCLMDLQGNIKAWNRMAEKIYGYSAADAVKMSVFDLIPANLKQQTRDFLRDVSTGVLVKSFETRRIAKDGSLLDISLKATRMVHDGKIVAVATTERDISEHNRLLASLQDLPRRIIMAQENERSRISHVLHSEFGQALIGLKLFTVVTSSALKEDNYLMKSVFLKIRARLDEIIRDTRNLAHMLSPPGLKYAGLLPAIKALVESTMLNTDLKISLSHQNMEQLCFKEKDIIIYRILQEALQNILKHSQASRVRVSAVLKKTVFTVEIRDNGIGFDTSLVCSSNGLGLPLMNKQSELINGRLSIKSQPGKGTSIKITVPIKKEKVA